MLSVNVHWIKRAALIVLSVFIPAGSVLAGACLKGDQVGEFRVYEQDINYTRSYMTDAQKLMFLPSVTPTQVSQEAVFVNGLADFIEARARAELRLWITQFLSKEICVNKDNAKDFFPSTCALNISESDSVFGIEQQYLALVLALRQDLEYLPACIVKEEYGSELGYMLHSIFEGYANNGSLDNLLYGLANKLQSYEVKNEFEKMFVFSVLVYSSAIEVNLIWDAGKHDAAVTEFLRGLAGRINKVNDGTHEGTLKAKYLGYLKKMDGAGADLQARMREFYQLRKSVLETTKKLKAAESREEAASLFIKNGEILFDQLLVLLRVGDMRNEIDEFNRNVSIARGLYSSYQAIEVHEYTRAFLELKPVLEAAYKKSRDEDFKKQLATFNEFSGALVSLAEAKSADDFSSRLDSLASPVGAWRLKSRAPIFSITALPGIRRSRDKYSSPGLSGSHEEYNWSIGSPVGVQFSWPYLCGGYCGVMVSLLDVGNIIDAPNDIETPSGRISGGVESSFSNVFTPGVYLSIAPSENSPINFIFGYSEGPSSGYRTLISDSGEEFPVERDRMVSISLSVDVTFFTF